MDIRVFVLFSSFVKTALKKIWAHNSTIKRRIIQYKNGHRSWNLSNVIYSYNGILFGNRKEWNTDTCYNRTDLESIMLSQRSQTQKVTYCISAFIWNVQNRQIYRDSKVDCWLRLAGEWRVTANRYCGVFLGGDENSSKLKQRWWLHDLHMLKTNELYALNGWILWYVNYISIKMFLKSRPMDYAGVNFNFQLLNWSLVQDSVDSWVLWKDF